MSTSVGGERREVHYRGQVQGVGFRFTARNIARRFQVTGFVMNLPDGTVKVVAEGTPDELDKFLAQVAREMKDYIQNVQVRALPATTEFQAFGIEHQA